MWDSEPQASTCDECEIISRACSFYPNKYVGKLGFRILELFFSATLEKKEHTSAEIHVVASYFMSQDFTRRPYLIISTEVVCIYFFEKIN